MLTAKKFYACNKVLNETLHLVIFHCGAVRVVDDKDSRKTWMVVIESDGDDSLHGLTFHVNSSILHQSTQD